eukprot:XP_011237201.1 PREDICTED: uncharacterized protein Gm38664 [Mus musculus]
MESGRWRHRKCLYCPPRSLPAAGIAVSSQDESLMLDPLFVLSPSGCWQSRKVQEEACSQDPYPTRGWHFFLSIWRWQPGPGQEVCAESTRKWQELVSCLHRALSTQNWMFLLKQDVFLVLGTVAQPFNPSTVEAGGFLQVQVHPGLQTAEDCRAEQDKAALGSAGVRKPTRSSSLLTLPPTPTRPSTIPHLWECGCINTF